MSNSEGEKLSEKEAFANAYYYFVRALEVLAADAATQCDSMGNFNVAWEIKDDVVRGAGVINMPNNGLSLEEKGAIAGIVAALNKLPSSVFVTATTRTDNMIAMKHPDWITIRNAASNLLRLLDRTTRRNQDFLFGA